MSPTTGQEATFPAEEAQLVPSGRTVSEKLLRVLLPERARGREPIALAKDATLALRPGRGGLVLACQSGLFLVTQAGDPLDHVLEPFQVFRSHGRGRVVAWALREGVLSTGKS